MPITKNALKKQRVDKKRLETNLAIRYETRGAIKAAKTSAEAKSVARLYQALDRAVAKKVIKLSRASRIKARILKAAKVRGMTSPFGKTGKKESKN